MSQSHTFTTWGRSASCTPAALLQPRDEDEVLHHLTTARRDRQRLKVVGAGHSWSDAACTSGLMLNLDAMNRTLDVDLSRGRVTVEAGIRLYDLIERLAQVGLALQNVGSVTQQSLAGALSTGTHGSGLRFGCLATQATGLRLLTTDGQARYLSPEHDPDLFHAAAVGIGALGVVTAITLQCEPLYDLEERCDALPFEEALHTMLDTVEQNEHVKLWWLPHTDAVQVYRYNRTHLPRTPRSPLRRVEEQALNRYGFSALLEAGRRRPDLIPPANRLVARTYLRPTRRVGRWDHLLTVPMPPTHRETEYGFPAERAPDLLRRLAALIDHHKLRVNFPVEVRFVAKDNLWMSGAYGRPSCQLGAYSGEGPDQARYFRLFEHLATEHQGRPHWGKEFTLRRNTLRTLVPRLDDFDALRRRLDPTGAFDNSFTEQVFGPRT